MRLPVQVEGIIFRRNGGVIEYLLLKRLPERNGFWQPVTGGMEEGETREEALRREIRKETGVKNIIALIEGLYYFEFSDPNPNQEYVYGVEVSPSEEIALDGKEHSECRWCSYKEALRSLNWKENKVALRRLNRTLTRLPLSYLGPQNANKRLMSTGKKTEGAGHLFAVFTVNRFESVLSMAAI